MILLDTNIIICYLKGEEKIIKAIDNFRKNLKEEFVISIITKIELISYPHLTENELLQIEQFLKELLIINVDDNIATICGYLRRKYKIALADAIIAATSLYLNTPLFTLNYRDFKKIKELKLIKL